MPQNSNKRPPSSDGRKAHVDRKRVEKIVCGKEPPKLTESLVEKVCHIDPRRKVNKQRVNPFLESLQEEACSMCQPPPSATEQCRIPPQWHHMPWDEVELMKHDLLDRRCHHIANAPTLDEVDLKALGMIDAEGHHASKELDEEEKQKAAEIGKKAHEELVMVCRRNKGKLECKLMEPHVKISHNVEVVDDDEEGGKEEPADDKSDEEDNSMLTARSYKDKAGGGSDDAKVKGGSSEDKAVMEEKEPEEKAPTNGKAASEEREPEEKKAPVEEKAASQPWNPPSQASSNPKVSVPFQTGPGVVGAQPIVVKKTIETPNGRIEFKINFQVHIKPKPK